MKELISLTKALSDKNRVRILCALLSQGELCVCRLIELLQVTGATVSRHLSILSNAGLIDGRKQGRWMLYRISDSKGNMRSDMLDWLQEHAFATATIKKDIREMKKILKHDAEELCRQHRGSACCPDQ